MEYVKSKIILTNDERNERFRLMKPLGEGGQAQVFLAFDSQTQLEVAMKVFQPGMVEDKEKQEDRMLRYEREVKLMRELSHPNLCRMLDAFVDQEGSAFIVMEYFQGQQLVNYLDELRKNVGTRHVRGSFVPPKIFYQIAIQLARGIKAMHDAGIFHRDLKPENILIVITPDGWVVLKIIDLGIGKRFAGQETSKFTKAGFVLGTPAFMAPEQIMNPDNMDHRVDLYAMGCILYEMMTANMAVNIEFPTKLLLQSLIEQYMKPFDPKKYPSEKIDGVNAHLEQLVLDLMERDSEKRPQTADEVIQRLMEAMTFDNIELPEELPADESPFRTSDFRMAAPRPSGPKSVPRRSTQQVEARTDSTRWTVAVVVGLILIGALYFFVTASSGRASGPVAGASAKTSSLVPGSAPPPVPSVLATPAKATADPEPSDQVPELPTSAVAMSKTSLPATEQEKLAALVTSVSSGGPCGKKALEFLRFASRYPTLPEPRYWLWKCTERDGSNPKRIEVFRKAYVRLTGNSKPPL
jgi:serine/threonine protein kinase